MIEGVGVDIENVGNSDAWRVASLQVLNNCITQMLDNAMGNRLMGDLVCAMTELNVCEQAGRWGLVAGHKNGGSRRRGGAQR